MLVAWLDAAEGRYLQHGDGKKPYPRGMGGCLVHPEVPVQHCSAV